MIITTPYDKGWKVKIDNKTVKTKALDNCFLSFDIEKGSHIVELRFMPDKFLLGLIISIISVLILTFVIIFKKKNRIPQLRA